MNPHERDAILWAEALDPVVSELATAKVVYESLKKGFDSMSLEEIHGFETALTEHEVAIAHACYNVGLAQGIGIKQQLAPVAA